MGVVDLRQVVSHGATTLIARLTQSIPARELCCLRPAMLEPEIVIAPRRALHDELRLLTGLVVDRVVGWL